MPRRGQNRPRHTLDRVTKFRKLFGTMGVKCSQNLDQHQVYIHHNDQSKNGPNREYKLHKVPVSSGSVSRQEKKLDPEILIVVILVNK